MNKNKLLIGRAIFTLIIIISFGLIIMNEKGYLLFSKKIENLINLYIQDHYYSLNNIIKSDITYQNKVFSMKITSKENENHYFIVNYSNKNITDTYEKDYVEGNNIMSYLEKKLEKEIEEKTNEKCIITKTTTFNNYSESVQERLLKEEDLCSLKFYTISKEIIIKEWNEEDITNTINIFITKLKEKNITPKSYTITLTNKQDITKSIKINNITEDNISKEVIKDIMNNQNTELLKENKITYKILN